MPISSKNDARERSRWEAQADAVTITRDIWGIAHVHGTTDATAVFGLMYAQAEDNFHRIETNYLMALGRLAEAEGESALFKDLRSKLFCDPAELKALYDCAPPILIALLDAWADGLNYYLATHPHVVPRVISRFEPWMALSFTEGGILGDIGRIPLEGLEAFYRQDGETDRAPRSVARSTDLSDFTGSNAFAIAPHKTRNGCALLLINPHPDFYFRTEVHISSDEGLNAYGSATWGQFFIYQGFNERLGWGHTTSGVDAVDEYLETVSEHDGGALTYRHGAQERPVEVRSIPVAYATPTGMAERTFRVYFTHHGPVIGSLKGRWVAIAMMFKPAEALLQGFSMMKAQDYDTFLRACDLKANSICNTVYADADGNIAYFHPQFIPRREDRFDFTRPVDGTDPATGWQGEHELAEHPNVLNPPNGWIANTNDAAFFVAGAYSPKPEDFPLYMDTSGMNPRTTAAARVLSRRDDFTLASLIEAAFDPYLPAFAALIPGLVTAYDELAPDMPLKATLQGQVEVLRAWDCACSVDSIETSLAVFWGEQMIRDLEPILRTNSSEAATTFDYFLHGIMTASVTFRGLQWLLDYIAERAPAAMKLDALATASAELERLFGSWRTPWGEINRFQRLRDGEIPNFDDRKPSVPVAKTSSLWGSLASFRTVRGKDTPRRFGVSGNSFVAAVEFGPRVQALAISAGGACNDPASPHFNDQGIRFTTGELRQVYFYRNEIAAHSERTYRPGV